ncbi:DsbA family oxidoreductase [Salimicrobium halophilum]|uniref:Predicted dithiol-disulfide isomerase, DsbA family n=1 Tax=Salimicrobium halophilum TaxID=86666 RepID=A0A1G8S2Z2_9BACI|nr:DsbA family oxidoreductase [Salimicrobium halophilum]SDJ23586.1 Predicted dithiol-disulfide isomerase, DsbA family [Salimicrobium halophilum]
MKIEIWSDFVCPFCYIGKRRLEQAVNALPEHAEVEWEYKSFELDPDAETQTKPNMHEKLAKKYNKTLEQAKEMTSHMEEEAKQSGLTFRFDQVIPANTFDAHRVAKFAEEQGKNDEVTEKFMQAVLTDGKNIGDAETIYELAVEAGLDSDAVAQVLRSEDYTEAVRNEEREAYQLGVQGVPFFVINRKYAISGAQPKETFDQALEQVWQEENSTPSFTSLNGATGSTCTEEGCDE